jgi:hypothetical protein
LNGITEIFTGIDHEVLLSVFKSWVNRLKRVIKHEEKYDTHSRKKETFLQDWQRKRQDTKLWTAVYMRFWPGHQ